MFEEQTVQTSDRTLSSRIYARNVIDVLRIRIKSAGSLNISTDSVIKRNKAGQTVYQHML